MRMSTTPINDNRSTFDTLGGFGAIRALVIDFYERVLDSDIVGHHFEDVEMPRLIDHQTRFLAGLLGGPASLDAERVARAHRHLGITNDEFNEVGRLLNLTLDAGGINAHTRMGLMALVEQLRSAIVTDHTVPAVPMEARS